MLAKTTIGPYEIKPLTYLNVVVGDVADNYFLFPDGMQPSLKDAIGYALDGHVLVLQPPNTMHHKKLNHYIFMLVQALHFGAGQAFIRTNSSDVLRAIAKLPEHLLGFTCVHRVEQPNHDIYYPGHEVEIAMRGGIEIR